MAWKLGMAVAAAAVLTMGADPAPAPKPTAPPLLPYLTGPMAPDLATHVATVALFGKPSKGFLNIIDRDAPPITIGHLYTAKAIELCIPEDPVCAPAGNNTGVHGLYAVNGMTDQAATFAARHLSTTA